MIERIEYLLKLIKNNSIKRVISNISYLSFLQFSNYLFPLITLPYLIRTLGVNHFGIYTLALTLSQYLIVISDYGFNYTVTREIAIEKDNKEKVSKLFSVTLASKMVLLLICFLLLTLIIMVVPAIRNQYIVYYIAFLSVLGNVFFPVWFFQGIQEMKFIAIINIIARGVTTCLTFLLVRNSNDYMIAVFLQSLGYIIIAIISMIVVFLYYRLKLNLAKITIKDMADLFKEGKSVFVSTVSGNVYGQGATIITGVVGGEAAAGLYSAGNKIASALVGLVQPIAQAIYPYISHLYYENKKSYVKVKKQVLTFGVLFGICISCVLYMTSEWLTIFLTGKKNLDLEHVLMIFSLIVFFTIMNVLFNPFILSMKEYLRMQRMYITVSILFLIMSIPLTYFWNEIGMVYSIFFVEIFISLNSYLIVRRGRMNEDIRSHQHT